VTAGKPLPLARATAQSEGDGEERTMTDASDLGASEPGPEPAPDLTATTDRETIRRWAEDRHATPATVGAAEQGGAVGELRLDFDFGNDLEDLRQVSWDEWFAAFDERGLQFVYQEHPRADGSMSNDFHLESRGQRG
jgi:hypothetical protein